MFSSAVLEDLVTNTGYKVGFSPWVPLALASIDDNFVLEALLLLEEALLFVLNPPVVEGQLLFPGLQLADLPLQTLPHESLLNM